MSTPTRYRFAAFTLSARQRTLWRHDDPVALIPKYFDLLLFLVRRRGDAVSKQVIFTEVWPDVVVSDGALAQAVRVLRRTLEDDAKEPRFIRTVARHGYQFVWVDVAEEADDGPVPARDSALAPATTVTPEPAIDGPPALAALVDRLLAISARGLAARDDGRDVAEQLHALGTLAAVDEVRARPDHAVALALLRDSRWNVAGAGPVPIFHRSDGLTAATALVRLRLADMGHTVANRWASAAGAGALGGALAGVVGGTALLLGPGSNAQPEVVMALAAVGATAGGTGAAGVGAGLAAAEALARSRRALALTAGGGGAGALVGGAAYLLLHSLVATLAGVQLASGGGLLEGLALGATAGASYAAATPQPAGGGVAAPTGRARIAVSLVVGLSCAATAVALGWLDRPLVGGHVHLIAQAAREGEALLAPVGRLLGEPGFGPFTQRLLGAFEGGVFGASLAFGLTHRPKIR